MPQKSTRGCSRPCHALAPDTLQGCPRMDHPECAGLMPTSAPAASPPRAPLCRASWDTPPCTHFSFSCSPRTLSVQRALASPGLYPFHLQLSFQGALCTESSRTTPAYTHFSSSLPTRTVPAQSVPGPPAHDSHRSSQPAYEKVGEG